MIARTSKCAPKQIVGGQLLSKSHHAQNTTESSVSEFFLDANEGWIPQTCLNDPHPGSDEDILFKNKCQASFHNSFDVA